MTLRSVPTREDLIKALSEWGLIGHGLEVGVYEGEFAEYILKNWPGTLYLVDPWEESDSANDSRRLRMYHRLNEFGNRFQVIRKRSPEAEYLFDDDELDWAYIDANHSYVSAKADIEAWWDKVRPGGLLMGHDYFDGVAKDGIGTVIPDLSVPAEVINPETLLYGVKSAVDEFVEARGLQLFLTQEVQKPVFRTEEAQLSPSWYFQKPLPPKTAKWVDPSANRELDLVDA